MFTRTKLKFVASIFIIAIYLMVPVFAYDTEPSRASKQIMSYSMDVKSTGNGRIAIIFRWTVLENGAYRGREDHCIPTG